MKNSGINNNSIERMLILLSRYEDDGADGGEGLGGWDEKDLEIARQTEKFLDMIPGGFFIYHAACNQNLIYANTALIRIFGCNDLAEFRALTGNSFKGMVHPDDYYGVDKSIKEQISGSQEDLDFVEYRIIRKDGEVRWVEDYGHFVRSDAIGGIYYVFISDATEKITKLLSEKQEKEEKLHTLIAEHDRERTIFRQEEMQRFKVIEGLSINYDSILYADLGKDEITPYRLGNRTKYYFDKKLQVRSFTELMTDYAKTWVHPEDRATVATMTTAEIIRKKLAEDSSFYVNYRCVENGQTKYLQLRIVNVGSKKRVSQIVLGFRTIDDEILHEIKQKSILQEALKSAKLASVAKNTFLSNMSHDMRTPLNAIFGYTALAKKDVANGALVAGYLEKIDVASRQILDLINNVLELTYLESQEFSFVESECNVFGVAQDVHKSLLPQAEQKNITLSLHLDGEHGDVRTDKEKLKQIIRHLADNAVKYTKDGGKVDITVREQRKENIAGEYCTYMFIISDTGIGISEETLPHIFEPFERENNTTYAGVYGLGLGLTIVKQIIECMGGSIAVESAVGKGSTFTVTLDLMQQKCNLDEAAQTSGRFDLNGKKILIVEDNPINMEIEKVLLSDLGCVVDVAENGQIAVEKVAASKPGEYLFVLMDIQMPVMDGWQATQEIRRLSDPRLSRIPVIALSANAFESDIKTSMEAGMNVHLTKPIDIPLLVETLKTLL